MSRTSKPRTILRLVGLVVFVGVCGLWVGAFVGVRLPPGAGAIGWVLDTIGQWLTQLAGLVLLGAVGLMLTGGLRSRRSLQAGGAIACLVVFGTVFTAVSRDRRLLLPARAPDADVRLLVFNAKSTNTDVDAIESLIDASGADVAVLSELNARFVRKYYTRGRGELSHVVVRAPIPGVSAWTLVMSRWPMQRLPGVEPTPGTEADPIVRVLVASPEPFELIGIHLPSPRSAARWAMGHELASSIEGVSGLPLVIAGDLNGSPVGGRERLLTRRAGVARSKPVLTWAGTFPSVGWGPTRLAIDGVWTDGSLRARSWRVGRGAGSDHLSLLVGLGWASGVDRGVVADDTGGAGAVGARSE